MGNALSTESGSAGMEMVLWSFVALIFVFAPLMCFLFETYTYGVYSLRWMTATENALDLLEWELETEALSETSRVVSKERAKIMLNGCLETLGAPETEESWTVEICEYTMAEPPFLEVQIKVAYKPMTMVGALAANSGYLQFRINRIRELAHDR